MYIVRTMHMIRYDEEVVGIATYNGPAFWIDNRVGNGSTLYNATSTMEFEQVAGLCEICKEGMVCDEPGLNHSQIFPEKHYMPMINTEPKTLEMMHCINNGLYTAQFMNTISIVYY